MSLRGDKGSGRGLGSFSFVFRGFLVNHRNNNLMSLSGDEGSGRGLGSFTFAFRSFLVMTLS
jgi:hypothetical protein